MQVQARWEGRPAAYLGFGETYAAELTFARAARWPVHVLDGHHLHPLAGPVATAEAVLALRERLA